MAREEQADLKKECEQTLSFLDQVIEDVRRLSRDMSPAVLEHFGLSTALRRLISDFARDYNIQLTLDMTEIDPFFTRDGRIVVYRIFQEVLTNIGKHAGASRFSVVVTREDEAITFMLEDDGKGFDMHDVSLRDVDHRGSGLDILDERVRMLGGVLDVSSREGKGTRITFRIPVDERGGA
jgi:signal transduction histidine kinase